MERESREDRDVEYDTTISRLKGLLADSPEVLGDQLEIIRQAVENAEREIRDRGELSQGMAEELDNLYRPFKPESLK